MTEQTTGNTHEAEQDTLSMNALIRRMEDRTPEGGGGETTPPGEVKEGAATMNTLIRARRGKAD